MCGHNDASVWPHWGPHQQARGSGSDNSDRDGSGVRSGGSDTEDARRTAKAQQPICPRNVYISHTLKPKRVADPIVMPCIRNTGDVARKCETGT